MSLPQILSVDEVREFLGDYSANNYLLNGVEFSDTRITLCMQLALGEYNSVTPLSNVNLQTISPNSKGILLDGTLWKLLEGMAQQLARNTMEYSDGGLNIPIEERSQLYMAQAQGYKDQFLAAAKTQKIQMNLDSGWGHVSSDSAYFPVW
jgi:hypothetical protein